MHEISVCQHIIKLVCAVAAQHPTTAVNSVHLQLGPLCGVEADLLRSAFPLVCADTAAAGAELVIHTMPIKIRCNHCLAQSTVSSNYLVCDKCGNNDTVLLSGNELLLEYVELQNMH